MLFDVLIFDRKIAFSYCLLRYCINPGLAQRALNQQFFLGLEIVKLDVLFSQLKKLQKASKECSSYLFQHQPGGRL